MGLKNVAAGSPGHVHFHAEQVTEGWTSRKEMGGGEFSAHKNFFGPSPVQEFFFIRAPCRTFLEGGWGWISFMRYWLFKKFTGKKVQSIPGYLTTSRDDQIPHWRWGI